MDEKYWEMAAENEQRQRDAAISKHKNRPKETPLILGGERVCKDCRDVIATQRLIHTPDAVRCVPCQEDHEKRETRYGH